MSFVLRFAVRSSCSRTHASGSHQATARDSTMHVPGETIVSTAGLYSRKQLSRMWLLHIRCTHGMRSKAGVSNSQSNAIIANLQRHSGAWRSAALWRQTEAKQGVCAVRNRERRDELLGCRNFHHRHQNPRRGDGLANGTVGAIVLFLFGRMLVSASLRIVRT